PSPPTMNAAFFSDGITSTQLALVHIDSGISDEFRNSLSTVVALLRSLTSSFESAPNARVAVNTPVVATAAAIGSRINHLRRKRVATGGPVEAPCPAVASCARSRGWGCDHDLSSPRVL